MPENRKGSGTPRKPNAGQFKKGQSGNPGGRPKTNLEVVTLVRSKASKALAVLEELMESGPAAVRKEAAKIWLDRAYGKPTQTIAVTGLETPPNDVGKTIEGMSDEQLKVLAGDGGSAPAAPAQDGEPKRGPGEGAGGAGPETPR